MMENSDNKGSDTVVLASEQGEKAAPRYIIGGWVVAGIFAVGAVVFSFLDLAKPVRLVAVLTTLYLAGVLVWLLLESRNKDKERCGDPSSVLFRLAAVLGLIGGLLVEVDLLRALLFGTNKAAHVWGVGNAAWARVTGGIGLAFVVALVILATLYALVEILRDE